MSDFELVNTICEKTGKEHVFKIFGDLQYKTMENYCCVDCGIPHCFMYGAVAVPVESIDWSSVRVVAEVDSDGNVVDTELLN